MRIRLVFFLLLILCVNALAKAEESKILMGHTAPVYTGLYTGNGTQLLTGSFDKTLRLWDLAAGSTVRTMAGHTASILCAAISSDGSRLVSGSHDHTIRLWDIPVSQPLFSHPVDQGTTRLALNHDGTQWLTGGADRTLRLWNATDRRLMKEIRGLPFSITRVAFRSDRGQIAAADSAGCVRLFNPADGSPQGVLGAHRAEITGLSYTPDTTWIVTSGAEGLVKRFPVHCAPIRVIKGHTQPILTMRVSPDNTRIVTGSADHK